MEIENSISSLIKKKKELDDSKNNINYALKLYKFLLFIIVIIISFFFNSLNKSNKINLKQHYIYNNNSLKTQILYQKNIRVCICTTGKEENRYIREFLIYYEKYGVDKIFLYDNNDINGERFEEIIKDFIDKGFVEIFDLRGKRKTGYTLRNDCYKRNKKEFDWIIFYDIDEYIYLKNFTNIKKFLIKQKFHKCMKINLNWVIHTDNNKIYYENRSLHERFPEIEQISKEKNYTGLYRYKFILRGKKLNSSMN